MFAVSKLLVPFDFSDASRGVAKYGSALARRFHSQMVVLHVAKRLNGAIGMETAAGVADLVAGQRESLISEMNSLLRSELRDIDGKLVVLEGPPATEIVRYAHHEHMELILMPTHGYGPFRRLLLGSVTARVLHDVSCPVWTGVHLEKALVPELPEPRKIVCAVDLGPQTQSALSWAAGMAGACQASLEIVHAIPCVSDPSWNERMMRIAQEQIAEHLATLHTTAEVQLLSGTAPAAVCGAARRLEADLLVIGRGHGTGLGGRLPSNAYTILREAPCPVVSV